MMYDMHGHRIHESKNKKCALKIYFNTNVGMKTMSSNLITGGPHSAKPKATY